MLAHPNRKKISLKDVPDVVYDSNSKQMFTKGRFLGKGGFARCYELIDNVTRIVYAGKVVSKTLLTEKHQKGKMSQEISIHRNLSHPHVVKMQGYFEDFENVYVILELCARRSLMELQKRRRFVSEPEARYFTHYIVLACEYLHSNKIIHRDLKLGNLFLNDEMQLKIGDFGLATKIERIGDRKYTLCGTPNYIAPEMLDKRGHSFEVDIWAIGCVLYTLLVGKPPFETETIKETYIRIKNNQYTIPSKVSINAAALITRLLAPNPEKRPRINEVFMSSFFTEGFLPMHLPTSCLTMAPKFHDNFEINNDCLLHDTKKNPSTQLNADFKFESPSTKSQKSAKKEVASILVTESVSKERIDYLYDLYNQLVSLQNSCPDRFNEEDAVEVQDPASTPVYWVSKWIDYSQKYGLGYQLCDNSIGIFFNDNTKIVLDAPGERIQYIEKNKMEHYYLFNNCPPFLDKKISLLRHFHAYMTDNLFKTGANIPKKEGDELARLPYLNFWFRSKSVIVINLSNGTLQVNFLQDHSKLILCPLMEAVTYIDASKFVATFKFTLLQKFGSPKDLWTRLKYTKTIIERILNNNLSSKKEWSLEKL